MKGNRPGPRLGRHTGHHRILLGATWWLAACAPVDSPPTAESAAASAPRDTDLQDGPCPDSPKGTGEPALTAQIPQFVSLWPRIGHIAAGGACVTVHRRTVVDHRGLLLTLDVFHDPAASEGFENTTVHSRLVRRPDPPNQTLVLSLSGAPGTSEETLQSDVELIVAALLGPPRR